MILVKGLASSSFRGLVMALGANESERKVIILSSSPVKPVRAGHLVLSSHWSRVLAGGGPRNNRPAYRCLVIPCKAVVMKRRPRASSGSLESLSKKWVCLY